MFALPDSFFISNCLTLWAWWLGNIYDGPSGPVSLSPLRLSYVYKIFYSWLYSSADKVPLESDCICAFKVCLYSAFNVHRHMCLCVPMWCGRMHAVCVCSTKGAGSETLVNRTIIWRPSQDSQQPLTVCLPERPTLLFLLHLHGPAAKGCKYPSRCVCVNVFVCGCNHVCNALFIWKQHFVEQAKKLSYLQES